MKEILHKLSTRYISLNTNYRYTYIEIRIYRLPQETYLNRSQLEWIRLTRYTILTNHSSIKSNGINTPLTR